MILQKKNTPNLFLRLGRGWEEERVMVDLAKLRALWPQVARRLAGEGWSEGDLLAARGLLASAVQAGDAEALAGWLVWMEQHLARPDRRCLTCAGRCVPRGTDGFCGGGRGDLDPGAR